LTRKQIKEILKNVRSWQHSTPEVRERFVKKVIVGNLTDIFKAWREFIGVDK
jgi:hypothetical protein